MRYGKIYFYDRCGNKVQDDLNPDVKEEVLTLPLRLERGHNTTQMLARGGPDFARLSPPFAARSQGYVPSDPFSKLDVGLDSPTIGPPPDELRSNDIDYSIRRRGLNSEDSTDDYKIVNRSVLPGDILSPLNDLQSSPDRRDDERMAAIRGIDKLDFDDSNGISIARRNADLSDDILSPGRNAKVTFTVGGGSLKHAQSTDDVVDRRYVEEEAEELCEHCLLEERRNAAARDEARLQKELQKHVANVNDEIRGAGYRRKGRDLLPMGVLPPFMNRDDDAIKLRSFKAKDAYRRELEDEMARKRLEAELEKVRDKAMHNDANTRDALAYARDQDKLRRFGEDEQVRNRDVLEKQMELTKLNRKESAERLEWWERRSMPGLKGVERDSEFLGDQLRRNEALKRSVDLLEQFKGEQKEENMARRALMKQHYDDLRSRIEQQSDLIRPRRYTGSASEVGRVAGYNPSVYKAWEDAHLRNDKRYRVLQDFGGATASGAHPRHVEEHSKCIRCRRCKRLIRKEVNRRVLEEARR
uniref:Uncharacterized protein n=1 Tax=Panagrellus redivivus TaxID=6233 RepID=A0A7E4VAW9_PANRE